MFLDKASKVFYRAGRETRNVKAIEKSIETGSPMPLVKRLINIWIGRHIVSRLWWR